MSVYTIHIGIDVDPYNSIHGEAAYVSHYVRGTLRQAQVLALPVASL